MPIYLTTKLPKSAQVALVELEQALKSHGETASEWSKSPDTDSPAIVVGLAHGADFERFLAEAKVAVPEPAESTTLAWAADRKQTLIIAGSDERGLTYALRDAARGIAVTAREDSWSKGITPATETPYLRMRNVSVHLFNADCEREWYFSEEYWRDYFARLSLSRFNRCTLTFCDQTNYLCPPYAYLVEMPEYPQVKVAGLTVEDRAKNLTMLRRIAALAHEYAIDFDLGIWMQAPVPKYSAKVKVTGLPEGQASAEYCALGLRRIYEACPQLDGLQLRMNEEAGVSAAQQTEFYRPLFKALAGVGRPLRVDLRFKGLQQATIDAAVDAGLDVTVSTKFWSEHFGLPYHPTVVDSHWAADRYSFGALLKKPRNFHVTYQLWTVGSQRVTLWGEPEYAARFAESCRVGDGEGFEVFSPLTDKGYGDAPGAWQVIADPAYRVGRWEQERYWMFYLSFGRMGYNPKTNPEVWQREFRHRFGDAAEHVEKAYRAASKVLPLITAELLPGASEWSWWPELDTGGRLPEYSRIQTSDPGQFSAIRSWEKTPAWRWEEWDVRPGFVDERGERLDGRTTPLEVSATLRRLAKEISEETVEALLYAAPNSAEWRITQTDFAVLSGLGSHHSYKILAATHQALFESDGQNYHLPLVASAMKGASASWRQIVQATEHVYFNKLVFGITPDSPRSRFGAHHSGDWRERLAEVEADERRVAALTGGTPTVTTGAESLLRLPLRPDQAPFELRHTPAKACAADAPIELRLESARAPFQPLETTGTRAIRVYVRPLDQTRAWREFPMTVISNTDTMLVWQTTIPPDALDAHFDLEYYFTLSDGTASWNWPRHEDGQPYFVVPVKTK